jgi:hypothetical protein
MPELKIRNYLQLKSSNNIQSKYAGDAFEDVKTGVEQLATKLGASPSTVAQSPASIGALMVAALNGIADCSITDHSSLFRAIEYFVEYSTDPAFPPQSTHIVALKSSRNVRIPVFLGATNVYFRAYSQYADGEASTPVNFGGLIPTGVATGGAGPALGAGQLAGTATATGQGRGNDLSRTNNGVPPSL